MEKQFMLFGFILLLIHLATNRTGLGFAFAQLPDSIKYTGTKSALFEKASKLFIEGMEGVKQALEEATKGLSKEVKDLTKALDDRLKQAEDQVKDRGKVEGELKTEIKNISEKHEELSKKHEDFLTLVDGKLADLKRLGTAEPGKKKSFAESLKEQMYAKGDKGESSIADRIKSNRNKQAIEFDLKAVGDMSSSNYTGTYFTGYDLRPGIVTPLSDAHLRPLFPQTTTEKDTVRFGREVGSEGAFGMVAPGGEKPQIDWDLQLFDAPVRKIAGYFRLPEEMIDDIPYLLGYLTGRGLEALRSTEDYQLLYGDGTGQNLTGLATVASAFAAGASAGQIDFANKFDVLVIGKKQLRKLNLVPNVVAVSPEDYATMRLSKGTDGHYIFPVLPGTDVITVDSTPIVQNNLIADGDFFIMDTKWMDVVDRQTANVRLYDQDRDNAIKNMITCVIEERLAFPIYRPQAIVKGSFATAQAAITA